MKILITGCSGRIGEQVLRFFVNKKIFSYANYNKKKVKKKYSKKFFKLYKGDIAKKSFVLPSDIDAVLHLGSVTYKKRTDQILKINLQMNKNIFRLVRKHKNIKKFIFFSTASIYGKNNKGKVNENVKFLDQGTYAISKFKSEKIFSRLKNVKVYNIRIPGVLGTNPEVNFISNLIRKIKKNSTVKIFNPQNLFNNTILINNLCQFLFKLYSNNFRSGTILLGSSSPMTIEKIVKTVKKFLKSKSKIIWNLKNEGFYLDISQAMKVYKFKPLKTEDTINSYIKNKYLL